MEVDAVDNKEPQERERRRHERDNHRSTSASFNPNMRSVFLLLATRLSVSSFGGPIGRWDYILMQRRQGPIIFANREQQSQKLAAEAAQYHKT